MLRDEYRDRFTDVRVHSIRAEEVMCGLGVASKFNSEWDFLTHLRDEGRRAAKTWLKNNYAAIGNHGTVDLNEEFLQSVTEMFDETG
jgi:NTE family protein